MKSYRDIFSNLILLGISLNIFTICGILLTSFLYFQFFLGELPCPLCMIQRMLMLLCIFGQVYILSGIFIHKEIYLARFMLGHGMTIFAALLGLVVSSRQILLHIIPNSPGYGMAFWGYHLYTYSLLVFFIELIFVGINLLFVPKEGIIVNVCFIKWTKKLFFILGIVIVLYVIASSIEEGFNYVLPDNPTQNAL